MNSLIYEQLKTIFSSFINRGLAHFAWRKADWGWWDLKVELMGLAPFAPRYWPGNTATGCQKHSYFKCSVKLQNSHMKCICRIWMAS